MTRARVRGLTALWMAFVLYGTLFPPAAVAAGTYIQIGASQLSQFVPIFIGIVSPLPFLQSLAFGFLAASVHGLMAARHYPGDWPAFGTILIVSVLLVAIGFYAAVAQGPSGGVNPQALVILQLVLTMFSVGVATILKFSQLSAAP